MCKIKKMLAVVIALLMTFSMFAVIGLTANAEDESIFKYEINNGEITITDCVQITEGNIVIPDTIEGYPVTAIGHDAFADCKYITKVTIPESIKTIDSYAFYNAKELKSINIPASITSIATDAFDKCTSLESVAVDVNNQYYESDNDGVVFNKDKTVLVLYPAGKKDKSYEVPDSVTSIGAHAFYYARNLENISFTDNLISIGNMAFFSSSVQGIIIPDNVTDIATDAFSCASIEAIILPDGITKTLNFNGSGLKQLFIPASVKKISKGSFANLQNFTDIYYDGSQEDWNKIELEEFGMYDTFENVTIHYSSCNEIIIQSKTNGNSINAVKKDSAFATAVKGYKYTVVDAYGKELAADSLVGTGCIVKLYDADKELSQMKQIVVQYDVNGDGQITAADARLALRASADLEKISGVYAIAANVNGDDDITASDARKILRRSAGLE